MYQTVFEPTLPRCSGSRTVLLRRSTCLALLRISLLLASNGEDPAEAARVDVARSLADAANSGALVSPTATAAMAVTDSSERRERWDSFMAHQGLSWVGGWCGQSYAAGAHERNP